MYTLSQMVDDLVAETRRPDLLTQIVAYVNQTIREVHFHPETNGAVLFRENMREALVIATADTGFGWDIPDESVFQAMQAVRYDSLNGDYADEMIPSRALKDKDRFYYRAGSRFNFGGYGGQNGVVALAYYEYPRPLKYRPSGSRYAVYDVESGWSYAPSAVTPELQKAARTLSSNWLLLRWADVLAEGIRAKIYKRVSDDSRARTSYSLYMSLRKGLVTSETADLGGRA